jgi:hypothetical protein
MDFNLAKQSVSLNHLSGFFDNEIIKWLKSHPFSIGKVQVLMDDASNITGVKFITLDDSCQPLQTRSFYSDEWPDLLEKGLRAIYVADNLAKVGMGIEKLRREVDAAIEEEEKGAS